MKNIQKLIFAILICEGVGLLGSIATFPSIPSWYVTLTKPSYTPPSWLFGPVWTILFVLMGVSLYLVWKRGLKKTQNKNAVSIFGLQLFLNLLWSVLFFGTHSPFLALIEILVLWFAILWTIVVFRKIDKNTTWLLAPYLAWVSFASILNLFIVKLN